VKQELNNTSKPNNTKLETMKTRNQTTVKFRFNNLVVNLFEKLGMYESASSNEVNPNAYDKYVNWVEKNIDSIGKQAA
jgi:hypothetical protein